MKMPSDELPPAPETALAPTFLPPPEIVREGLAKLQASEEQMEQVLWLLEFGQQARGAKTRGDLGRLIGVSDTTISRLFSGAYQGSIDSVVSKIRNVRGAAGVTASDGWPLVELRLWRDIWSFCDAARNARQMGILWGENQSGKTKALEAYARKVREASEGRTFYVRVAAGGATVQFMRDLAKACGRPIAHHYQTICEDLIGTILPKDLLIIDEYHQIAGGRTVKGMTVERVREIHDRCGCGMVLCGTRTMMDRFETGGEWHKFLAQTANRGALRRQIAVEPYKADIEAVFRAYGFPPLSAGTARDKAWEVAQAHGLGRVCRQLQLAFNYARKKGAKPSLDHYTTAARTMEKWAQGLKEGKDEWTEEGAE